MRRRVVITGMGAVTPLGHSVKATMDGQLEGKSGVGPIQHFDASQFPSIIPGPSEMSTISPWAPARR